MPQHISKKKPKRGGNGEFGGRTTRLSHSARDVNRGNTRPGSRPAAKRCTDGSGVRSDADRTTQALSARIGAILTAASADPTMGISPRVAAALSGDVPYDAALMLHGAGCLLSCHGTDIVITTATGTLPRAPIAARLDLSSLAWEFEVASIMHRLSRASPVERVAHVVSAQPADAPEVLPVGPPGSTGAGRDYWHHPCSDHLRDMLDAAGKPEIAKLIRCTPARAAAALTNHYILLKMLLDDVAIFQATGPFIASTSATPLQREWTEATIREQALLLPARPDYNSDDDSDWDPDPVEDNPISPVEPPELDTPQAGAPQRAIRNVAAIKPDSQRTTGDKAPANADAPATYGPVIDPKVKRAATHLADTKAKKGPQGAHTAVIPAAEAARSLRVAKAKATLARFVRNQSTKAAKAASAEATIAAVLPAAEAARAQRVAKARTALAKARIALARLVTEQSAKVSKTQATARP